MAETRLEAVMRDNQAMLEKKKKGISFAAGADEKEGLRCDYKFENSDLVYVMALLLSISLLLMNIMVGRRSEQ